ncbi:MAG: hypothetical protein QOC94_4985 [Actinoplanes sp.]|nr:hypothetical protein [Actinoplanes sp.]
MTGPQLTVSGGAGGTTATYADLRLLGRSGDDLAETLASISLQCHAMLTDPDLLACALLDPGGAAAFEKELLGALDGGAGLTTLAVGFAERSVALRVAAASYQAADEASAKLLDGVRWTAGFTLPLTAAAALPLLPVLAAAGTPVLAPYLTPGGLDYQRLITDHPGIVDDVVGAGPGLLSLVPGLTVSDVPGAAHLLGNLYPDGTAEVSDRGTDTSVTMKDPPRTFTDLVAGLDYRDAQSHPGEPDQIDVRVITHADGSKAYVVDIPGTKVWDLPGSHNDALNDLGTNVHVLGGDVTARENGISEALRRAGATATDPVLLVGHSQGGMVAAQAAQDSASGRFDYNVTHVLTAGSPVARYDIPDNVQMLCLENEHDIVPHLDAADNPDQPNRTTVTFDSQQGTIGDNHGTRSAYLPAATSLDHSTDPSVAAYRDSAGAFLTSDTGSHVQSNIYDMTRTP